MSAYNGASSLYRGSGMSIAFSADNAYGEDKHTYGNYEARPTIWDTPLAIFDENAKIRPTYISTLFNQDFGSYAASKLHSLGIPDTRIVFTTVTSHKKRKCYEVFDPISRYLVRVHDYFVHVRRLKVEEIGNFSYDTGSLDLATLTDLDTRDIGMAKKAKIGISQSKKPKKIAS